MSLVDTIMPMNPHRDRTIHEERMEMIVDALKDGAHLSTAASLAGISPTTLNRWVNQGRVLREVWDRVMEDPEDDREPSVEELELIWLADEVMRAEAKAELKYLRIVQEHATSQAIGDRGAATWMLEHRFKERWASRSEVTGGDGGAIGLEVAPVRERRALTQQKLVELERRVAEADEIRGELMTGGEDEDEDDSAEVPG